MKSFLQFLRATITGGILFLIPVILVIIILDKATDILSVLAAPLSKRLPDNLVFGLDGSNLVAILLLIVICFIAGLFFRWKRAQKGIHALEERLLKFLPGYSLIKSLTADILHADAEVFLKPVMFKDEDSYSLGFLVEETKEGLCTVFIPEAPRCDSGEVKIVKAEQIQKLNVTNNQVVRSLRAYGKGVSSWIVQ